MAPNLSISTLTERLKATAAEGYEALELDEDLCNTLQAAQTDTPDAMKVRPHKDGGGIEAGRGLLESLHTVDTTRFRGKNVSSAYSFEVRFSEAAESITLQFVPGTADAYDDLAIHVADEYPNAAIERTTPELLPFEPGLFFAGAELELNRYTLFPIKNEEIGGFRRDPWGSLTSEMVGSIGGSGPPVDVVAQILFRPVGDDWVMGVNGDSVQDLAYSLRQPSIEYRRKTFTKERIEHDPSKQDKQVADMLQSLTGEKGWSLNLRVFAVSPDKNAAIERTRKVAGKFRNYYETSTRQRFEPVPLRGGDLRQSIQQSVGREWNDEGIVKSEAETAALVHAMDDQINTQLFDWTISETGYGVPPGTPRVDFADLGVSMADEKDKQVAMIENSERGDPYMFGLGTRNGIEAGVTEETFDTHAFIGGRSGAGKTSHGKNLFRQVTNRGYGCLVYDPKGMDAEDFAALVPEGREDDLVFVELGSNREHQVGFNFLEAPGTAEPGTAEHSAALEAMADDLEAILPLAAGDGENSWGTRMSRIARNIARGLGKLDREVTLYDAHIIANDAAGREAYAGALDAEDVNFVKDYAINHLAEMDDDEIEPFAGRLQQLIENETVREIVTIKDGFSIDEAVEEGKIIIVQDNDKSDTTGQMVATALIRRIWVSIREQTFDDDRPDPEKFYALLDEFDEIATVNSDVANIFSDARSFGLSLIPMTQDLSSEKIDKKVREMIEGQAETFISYDPGREGEARMVESQHSDDIEYSDLLDLSKYRFYMRTHDDNGELTHSYKVQATPPIDELAPEIVRSEEETDALIDRRVREVGNERRTDEEIMDSATIYDEADGDTDEDDTDEDDEHPALVRAKALQAIYDAGYYDGDENGYVSLQTASDRIARYCDRVTDDVPETPSQIEGVLGQFPPSLLERDYRDGELHVRCTDEGKARFLTPVSEDEEVNENTGGMAHADLWRDAYDDLLAIGLPLHVCHQEGDDDPDAVANPESAELRSARSNPALEPAEVASLVETFREKNPLLDRLTDAKGVDIEAEHSTGDTAPGVTLEHIARSIENGRRCLLLARPDTAEAIARRLDEHPKCMRTFSDGDGVHRLYNANGDVRAGPNETRVYRPAGGQSVWLYREDTATIELQDSDGETLATFDSGEDVFADPTAYPATEGDITDVDSWSTVKRPALPSRIDRDMVDVIAVTDDGLEVLADGDRVPIGELVGGAGEDASEESGLDRSILDGLR